MKIFDTPCFLEQSPYQPLHFYAKNLTLFLENITKTQSLPPVYKGGGSLMVAGLKCLKIMQFQRIFFCFKGLKLPHKMIRKSMQAQNSIDNC